MEENVKIFWLIRSKISNFIKNQIEKISNIDIEIIKISIKIIIIIIIIFAVIFVLFKVNFWQFLGKKENIEINSSLIPFCDFFDIFFSILPLILWIWFCFLIPLIGDNEE